MRLALLNVEQLCSSVLPEEKSALKLTCMTRKPDLKSLRFLTGSSTIQSCLCIFCFLRNSLIVDFTIKWGHFINCTAVLDGFGDCLLINSGHVAKDLKVFNPRHLQFRCCSVSSEVGI